MLKILSLISLFISELYIIYVIIYCCGSYMKYYHISIISRTNKN